MIDEKIETTDIIYTYSSEREKNESALIIVSLFDVFYTWMIFDEEKKRKVEHR